MHSGQRGSTQFIEHSKQNVFKGTDCTDSTVRTCSIGILTRSIECCFAYSRFRICSSCPVNVEQSPSNVLWTCASSTLQSTSNSDGLQWVRSLNWLKSSNELEEVVLRRFGVGLRGRTLSYWCADALTGVSTGSEYGTVRELQRPELLELFELLDPLLAISLGLEVWSSTPWLCCDAPCTMLMHLYSLITLRSDCAKVSGDPSFPSMHKSNQAIAGTARINAK